MKTRKKPLYGIAIVLILIQLGLLHTELRAQSVQGIYLSANDFTNNKLSYDKNVNENCKIKMHSASFNSHIKIICGETSLELSKDSVFGFKDRENISHRFYNKKVYEVMNPGANILVYKIKVTGKTKYEPATYNYYFSKEAKSPVLPLTIKNLEASFSDNQMFIDFLEVHFKTDGDLLEYDINHAMYKVNYLLELSKNQK
jgi:hypothetical protein